MSSLTRTLDLSTLGAVVLGTLLLVLGLQVDGFLGGMGQGAGAALVVLGVVLLVKRLHRPAQDDSWLPSRDGAPDVDR